MAASIKSLQSKRRVEKSSISRALTFAQNPPAEISAAQIEARSSRLDAAYDELKELTKELYNFDEDKDFTDPEDEFTEYEGKYFTAKGIFREMLDAYGPREPIPEPHDAFYRLAEQQSTLLNRLDSPLNVRNGDNDLPKIRIEPFTGNYKDWPAFKDIFNSAINSKPNLTNIQKFHYLKSVLKDDAANLIKHMQVTDLSYSTAWDRLKERYDRPRHIVNSYIETFMALSAMKEENPTGLRRVSDISNEVIRGLEAIGYNERDHWLIYILQTKIDADSRRRWIENTRDEPKPTIYSFLTFLDQRCEEIELGENTDNKNNCKSYHSKRNTSAALVATNNNTGCTNCRSGEHFLQKCPQFLSLSVNERRKFVKEKHLCFNCLRAGHTVYSCKSKNKCRSCQRTHNSLLHNLQPTGNGQRDNFSSGAGIVNSTTGINPQVAVNTLVSQSGPTTTGQLGFGRILPTALVNVRNHAGNFIACRALLDTASEYSYISEDCMKRLGLPRNASRMPLAGIQSIKADPTRGHTTIRVISRQSHRCVDTFLHVLGHITTSLPRSSVNNFDSHLLSDLSLADPQWHRSSPIDILLGADVIWDILLMEKRRNEQGKIVAVSTFFGWVVTSGVLWCENHVPTTLLTLADIDQSIRAFWEIENCSNTNQKKDEESIIVEQHFKKTHSRSADGKYIVELPFKEDNVTFADTHKGAITRFNATERRLSKNPTLQSQYVNFMREYQALGHMRELKLDEINVPDERVYYLPHHPIVGLKLRVVFDGSFKDAVGISLNEKLYVGPAIQRNLFAVCLRFRLHKFVFSADIIKMFRQIWVAQKHQNFQRIIWRERSNEPLRYFQLCTVTYGTASAPFLSVRVLEQIASDYKTTHPNASRILLEDFYVDDVLTGASSEQQLLENKNELVDLLAQAGLQLSKWVSNSDTITLSDDNTPSFLKGDDDKSTKVLGIHWYSREDLIGYKINLENTQQATKRRILSDVARIFDPLGLVSPVVVKFKILFQELWLMKLGWDDPLPASLANLWLDYREDLRKLDRLKLPRFTPNINSEITLHGFSDASMKAYSAVVYCVVKDNNGDVHVSLIASKTRVSPLKLLSLPRLELCGALLLTRLMKSIRVSLPHDTVNLYAWCDSTVVLAWLSVQPIRLKIFVGNRTSEILETLPRSCWGHVGTRDNPADCASRGLKVDQLLDHDLWWSGPSFLKNIELQDINASQHTSDGL